MGIASTMVVLIPKKDVPTLFADFRPISLCTFINKIFTKILVNRLKEVLPSLISSEQSAFVCGREISDNILLAQELLVSLDRKVRGNNIILKLDTMKDFDRVSWDFLSRLLVSFGLHPRFIGWIMNNLTSAWFSILVNGKPCRFFQAKRGLKQGDPLSPFLFILVSEILSQGLKNLLVLQQIQPYAVGRGCTPISHLAFPDDIVVFTRGDWRSMSRLMAFLETYQNGSGQKLNVDKSFFVTSARCLTFGQRLIARWNGFQ